MFQRLVRVCLLLLCGLVLSPVSLAAGTQVCDAKSRKDCTATAECAWQTTGACETSGEAAMGCAGYMEAKPCNEGRNTSGAKCEWVLSEQCVRR